MFNNVGLQMAGFIKQPAIGWPWTENVWIIVSGFISVYIGHSMIVQRSGSIPMGRRRGIRGGEQRQWTGSGGIDQHDHSHRKRPSSPPQRHSPCTIPMTTDCDHRDSSNLLWAPRIHSIQRRTLVWLRRDTVSYSRWSKFSYLLPEFRSIITVNLESRQSASHSTHCELTV